MILKKRERGDGMESQEEWKKKKQEQRARFTATQRLPYEVKLERQKRRAWEFYEKMQSMDMNCHVSVGGLDSITLYLWLKSIGIHVPAISVSGVEDKSIQKIHKELGIERQKRRAWEFYEKMQSMDMNCHVSVGGLDSITLYLWLKSIGIHVPAISVSGVEDKSIQKIHKELGIERIKSYKSKIEVLNEVGFPVISKKIAGRIDSGVEDKSIQKIHKELGIERIKSYKSKIEVLNEVGFPVISKKIAGRIDLLQHPTEHNKTVRHAIITGECGEQGHFAKNSRMQLPKRWLELFGGPENETEGVQYKTAPFLVSNKCCYFLKEKPCDDWAKEHNSHPYLGMMASEGQACYYHRRMWGAGAFCQEQQDAIA